MAKEGFNYSAGRDMTPHFFEGPGAQRETGISIPAFLVIYLGHVW